jgi:hypothetical protein
VFPDDLEFLGNLGNLGNLDYLILGNLECLGNLEYLEHLDLVFLPKNFHSISNYFHHKNRSD